MTRADIEEMLTNLAETMREVRENSRRTREAAERITGGAATRLDAVGTDGGKATVATRLPLVLTLEEMAEVYRISESTIRRGLQNGTFSPRPWKTYPYRWTWEAVDADMKRRPQEPTRRAHGFAAKRARRIAKGDK